MIMPCTCYHEYQDKIHGKGKRVYNETLKGWRCTVCGSLKTKGEVMKETK